MSIEIQDVTGVRLLLALALAPVVLAACGGDGLVEDEPPPSVTRETTPSSSPSATASRPASGATVEVQGIVGSVDEANRTIEINRLQGAEVDVIELSTSTRIRDARGGTLRLGDIRPSDRIVARGRLEGGALIAHEVTVSQVVRGGQPGG